MNMTKRRELITKYKELWDKYAKENPDRRFLETVLRHTCGFDSEYGDKIEQFPILMIPVTELAHPNRGDVDWRNYQANEARWSIKDIVAKRNDLAVFGTDFGEIPGAYKVFGTKGILEFLMGFKVDYVLGCLRHDEDVDIAHVGIPLGAMAFQADPKVGEAFAYMVNAYGGGLRYEYHQGQSWCVFESE